MEGLVGARSTRLHCEDRPLSRGVGYRSGRTTAQSYTRKGPAVSKNSTTSHPSGTTKYVGLDVHKETIAAAVADSGTAVPRLLGIIRNDLDQVRKLLRTLGPPARLRVCYEAGPCGYVIYRFLQRLKIDCCIIAPSLIPRKAGDRVKTDRRDALMLARLLRSGELTATWVPDREHEALRDLVRAREDAVEDRLRARHRLGKFLLRLGITPPPGVRAWSVRYQRWLDTLRWQEHAQALVLSEYRQSLEELDQRIRRYENQIAVMATTSAHAALIAGLQAMRGVKLTTAATIVSELGDVSRFPNPRQLMAYAGLVPVEHSSGGRVRRGGITKTGNAHLRRVMVEAAWHYRHRAAVTGDLRQRQRGVPAQICAVAWSAQQRLHKRFCDLRARGKAHQLAVIAVARELLGFIWSIARVVGVTAQQKVSAAA